jgi:phenylalanyl-tRNA synthetase beta chain
MPIISIYKRLGFAVGEAEDVLVVTVPSRRGDIRIEEDLMCQAACRAGRFRKRGRNIVIPVQSRRFFNQVFFYSFLEGAGLSQATTYSLTNDKKAAAFAIEKSFNTMLALSCRPFPEAWTEYCHTRTISPLLQSGLLLF